MMHAYAPWRSCAMVLLIGALSGASVRANNLSITQPMLVDFNSVAGTVDARFTISWQNSWRTTSAPANWDAAWVFLKFRVGTADPTRTGVSSTGTTLNVGSTALLRVGMPVIRTAGTGAFAANTVITAIPNATQVTISAAPTTALAGATVRFIRIWEHARLATDASHLAPVGSTIRTGLLNPAAAYNATTNYGVGAFIYRSANGTGTFTASNVELRWNLGTQGLGSGGPIEVCAFGHEMVYVTGGSFRLGSGAASTANNDFFMQPNFGGIYQVTSEAAISIGAGTGNLWYSNNNGEGGDQGGPVPAAFPKGFTSFYCMKYEITQGDYVDFLNKLTRAQQNARTGTALAEGTTAVTNRFVLSNAATISYRNGIRCPATISATDPITFYCDIDQDGVANEANDGRWVACNFLTWNDVAAYLDWSGLRPLSDLEFEKACRGPAVQVLNEYAWGTATIGTTGYAFVNLGTANEQITTNYATAAGNAIYLGTGTTVVGGAGGVVQPTINGPARVGITAHHALNNGRVRAGAGYYGALDLSGNVAELIITIGVSQGRSFTGTHGNGLLTAAGNHDAAAWPATTAGSGYRGGHWYSTQTQCRASDRSAVLEGMNSSAATRNRHYGGRGVRTMP